MNQTKITLVLAALAAGLLSCGKMEYETHTVSGTLYDRCGKPLAGEQLELIQPSSRDRRNAVNLTVTTDAAGRFRFDFEDRLGLFLEVRHEGSTCVNNLLPDRDYNEVAAVLRPTVTLKFRVSLAGPVQDNKPLQIARTPTTFETVQGPFQDGQIVHVMEDFELLPPLDGEGKTGTWQIGYGFDMSGLKSVDVRFEACTEEQIIDLVL